MLRIAFPASLARIACQDRQLARPVVQAHSAALEHQYVHHALLVQ